MSKLDLRKELKQYYKAKKKPEVIDVPPGKFLTLVGRGEPGGEAYDAALKALYGLSYTLKFKCKAEGRDFTVMALEGLWWWDDPGARARSVGFSQQLVFQGEIDDFLDFFQGFLLQFGRTEDEAEDRILEGPLKGHRAGIARC